jgi:uncharacterized protein with HEPN domain
LRELQILAESTQRISEKLKKSYPAIPWEDISGFRNVLVHDYLGINLNRVWEIIEKDIPSLREAAKKMLNDIQEK